MRFRRSGRPSPRTSRTCRNAVGSTARPRWRIRPRGRPEPAGFGTPVRATRSFGVWGMALLWACGDTATSTKMLAWTTFAAPCVRMGPAGWAHAYPHGEARRARKIGKWAPSRHVGPAYAVKAFHDAMTPRSRKSGQLSWNVASWRRATQLTFIVTSVLYDVIRHI